MSVARGRAIALTALAIAMAGAISTTAAADVGTPGPGYAGATAPTGEKPQSKLWFNDGTWWGVLFNPVTTDFEIFRRDAGQWVTTGVRVDPRNRSWQDVRWDGTHLQVVSAGTSVTDTGAAVRYSRFGYDSATGRYVPEIPQTALTSYGVEAAVLDEDAAGTAWVTFTHDSQVWVTHSTTDQATWRTPYVLPVPGADTITPDDISAVVRFEGHVGVMWGNQNDGTYYWAAHADGDPDDAWQESIALRGPELSDDHMNLKALDDDPAGLVFAAVKTSLDRLTDPMTELLVLGRDGTWHNHVVFRVGDSAPTRAQVEIDTGRRELYVFATEPCCSGGAIFMKKTSLDDIAFEDGKGTPVIQSSTDVHINNPNTSKQLVDATTGLPVIAGDDATHRYWHTFIPLDGADIVPPETTITEGPSDTTSATTAELSFTSSEPGSTFACSLDGAPFAPCASPTTLTGLGPGDHSFQVRATDAAGNVDLTPAVRTWTVSASSSLFLDGFETGDFSAWSRVVTGGDGTATVEGATVSAGAYSARLSETASTGSLAYVRRTLSPAPTSVTVSGTYRVDAEGAPGGNVPLLRLFDPAGTRLLTLFRPNGNTKLYVGHSGVNAATTARLPSATFANFEVQVTTAGAGASTVVVRSAGVEVYRSVTASLGTAGVGAIQIGNDTKQQPFVVYVDDVEVR